MIDIFIIMAACAMVLLSIWRYASAKSRKKNGCTSCDGCPGCALKLEAAVDMSDIKQLPPVKCSNCDDDTNSPDL